MRTWSRWLGSLAFWGFVLASSIALFPVALLIWALTVGVDRRLVLLHRFTCLWASLYTWLNPVWRVEIEGLDELDRNAAYVIVANHQSLLDILVLFRLFTHFKWVSKAENFRVPLIGWNMRLNRYIKLIRGDTHSVDRMMAQCERTLRDGSSIMMFPEGPRSRDGRVKPFKHGAFTLAKRVGAPILPIAIHGTAAALPSRGFVLQGRHAISIRVLEPIPVPRIASLSVTALADEVRGQIAAHVDGLAGQEANHSSAFHEPA